MKTFAMLLQLSSQSTLQWTFVQRRLLLKGACLGGLRRIPVQDITRCSIRRRCLAIERASRRPALESAVDMEIATSACPLACWSDNAANFLLLAAQAKHFLGAPHTSVATEHLFSSAVNI